MVSLHRDADGIVTLRFVPPYGEDDEGAYLEALDAVGAMSGPYALLTVFGGGGRLSQAGERRQALWYKATREGMNRACRAIAIVRPGATQAMAETFQKLWAFPVTLQPDEAAARAALLPCLRRGP